MTPVSDEHAPQEIRSLSRKFWISLVLTGPVFFPELFPASFRKEDQIVPKIIANFFPTAGANRNLSSKFCPRVAGEFSLRGRLTSDIQRIREKPPARSAFCELSP